METVTIKRVNHVARLCKGRGWTKKQFLKEAGYKTNVSIRTLDKAFEGETDLSMDTVEELARLFSVSKDEVIESVY